MKFKCKCGCKSFSTIEYAITHPNYYDGASELRCSDCGTRYGRWTKRELGMWETEPPYGRQLQSISSSKVYPYKLCFICKSKKQLKEILYAYDEVKKMGSSPRCGYIGFLYFKTLAKAIEVRAKYYDCKNLYVLLQNDKEIIKYYEKRDKA